MTIDRTTEQSSAKKVVIGSGKKELQVLFHDANLESAELQRIYSVGEDSTLRLVTIILGGHKTQLDHAVRLEGRGAQVIHYVLIANSDAQQSVVNLDIDHVVGESTSRTYIRKILNHSSSNQMNGVIRIHQNAQKSDGVLEDSSLLLSDSVTNRSIPGLEIDANDVKARHGSSQSRLPKEQLLYLQSRGIAEGEAVTMLVDGFAAKVYEEIGDARLRQEVKRLVQSKLHA